MQGMVVAQGLAGDGKGDWGPAALGQEPPGIRPLQWQGRLRRGELKY